MEAEMDAVEEELDDLTPNGIAFLLEKDPQDLKEDEGLILQSRALYRYSCDQQWVDVTHLSAPASGDVFDIVLSDGMQKLKCVLGTDLYDDLIPRRQLFGQPLVRVSEWRRGKNEGRSGAEVFVIILKLEYLRPCEGLITYLVQSGDSPNPESMETPWANPSHLNQAQLEHVPLVGSRGFYWTYLADDAPYDDRWCPNTCAAKSSDEVVGGSAARDSNGKPYVYRYHEDPSTVPETQLDVPITIKELKSHRFTTAKTREYGRSILIARVISKTNLISFATSARKRYPVTFSVQLLDATGTINCQIWEGVCARTFGRVNINDVVAICTFRLSRVRESFTEVEITLNVNGYMQIISGPLLNILNFPPVRLNLQNDVSIIETLPTDKRISVLGIVVYSSEMFRLKDENGKWVLFRWILLKGIDGKNILVQVACNSQYKDLELMMPGEPICLVALKIIKITDNSGLVIFLQTTNISQYFTRDRLKHIIRSDGKEEMLNLTYQMAEDNTVMDNYREIDAQLQKYRLLYIHLDNKDLIQQTMYPRIPLQNCNILLRDLEPIVNSLCYKERKFVLAQGILGAITVEANCYKIQIESVNGDFGMIARLPYFPPRLCAGRNFELTPNDMMPDMRHRLINFLKICPNPDPKEIESLMTADLSEIDEQKSLLELVANLNLGDFSHVYSFDLYSPTPQVYETEVIITGIYFDENVFDLSTET